VNGRNGLALVVLKKISQQLAIESDPFVPEEIEQLRVLKLVPLQNATDNSEVDRSYQVELGQFLPDESFRTGPMPNGTRRRGKKKWKLTETITPARLGKPPPLIPFIVHGPRHSLPAVDNVALNDIIAIDLDPDQLDADDKPGMYFSAPPTASLPRNWPVA